MTYCLNPDCPKPNNPPSATNFCQSCGEKLLLNNLFRATGLLGQGGFGRTFRAVNQGRFDEPCVIKQLSPPPQVQHNPALLNEYIRLFNQEARRLYELGKHPQIPELISYFEQGSRLYLVQELIDGQNLLQEMQQQGAFNEEKIRHLLADLLPVLKFIHSRQVIHRDIKPENIIRRTSPTPLIKGAAREGEFVLIDFGGAKQITQTSLNKAGTGIYTFGYAPTEQTAGRVCDASDLYAFGATCARLLTGCLPVPNEYGDIEDNLYDAMNAEWLWRDRLFERGVTLSNQLGKILDKLLQHLPKDRYQSADEVLQDLGIGNQGVGIGSILSHFPTLRDFEFDVVTVDARGRQTKRQRCKAELFAIDLGNRVTLEMVSIPGGTFLMGSPDSEKERYDSESPQHRVTVAPFFMGKTLVTQAQWKAVAALPQINISLNPDPSKFKGASRPVENVSWDDAVEFCARLSRKTGRDYRLPSEAQWEYACRAGTTTPFHFGETITPLLANYDGNGTYGSGQSGEYREQTTVVGSCQVANAFGLYDMHGNVWEWCADPWHNDYQGATSDGTVWEFGSNNTSRLLRGGSWYSYPTHCRSAYRTTNSTDVRNDYCGFRVAVSF